MKRKLVKQGNGALTITLPYSWVDKNNLKKGDYLDLLESNKDLILSSNIERNNKSYEITISKNKPFFKRYLRTCYVLGYDEIIISSEDVLPVDMIKEILTSLIGYEIIEQNSRKCVISIVALPFNQNFDIILKRIFFMIDSMIDDIIDTINKKNYKDLLSISLIESSINKFVDFCLRILNKKGYSDFQKTPYLYQILIELEQVGDALRDFSLNYQSGGDYSNNDNNDSNDSNNLTNICSTDFNQGYNNKYGKNKNISNNNKNSEIIIILNNLKEYFHDLQFMFFKYDMKKIKEIKKKRIELYTFIRQAVLKYPVQMLDLYLLLSTLHQFEIAIDPINS
jgi:phosphate uptake regulator